MSLKETLLWPARLVTSEKFLTDLKPKYGTDSFDLNYVYVKRLTPSIVPFIVSCTRCIYKTVHFVNCKLIAQQKKKSDLPRNLQHCYFFYLLCCFGFHGEIAKTLRCSKLLQKATMRNPKQNVWNPEPVCHEQIIIYVFSNLRCRGIPNCK